MKIVVLSDTHLRSSIDALPEQVLTDINDADIVIHAGDFTTMNFYNSLNKISDLKAVYGNMDSIELKKVLPEKLQLELCGFKIAIIHGNQVGRGNINKLFYIFPEADIIISGHTHKALNKKINGKLLFNPGSAVEKRLQPNYSYGIIYLGDDIKSKIIKF